MKSKELPILVFLVLLIAVLSYLVSTKVFNSKSALTTKVEVVQPVSSSFDYQNKPYFSGNPLNPTKDITVTDNNNQKPLGQ